VATTEPQARAPDEKYLTRCEKDDYIKLGERFHACKLAEAGFQR
jgi:hypothetical protein